MIFPRWALSADKRLPWPASVDPNRFAAADLGPREQGSHHAPGGRVGPARRRSPVVGAWFSSRLQPSIPLAPTSSICRLLNADARPFRSASQGSEGSSPPRPPRRTATSALAARVRAFSGFSVDHGRTSAVEFSCSSLSMLVPGAAAALAAVGQSAAGSRRTGLGHRHLGQLEDDVASMIDCARTARATYSSMAGRKARPNRRTVLRRWRIQSG